MSSSRNWSLAYDNVNSGSGPTSIQKPIYCRDYQDDSPQDSSAIRTRHSYKTQAAANTLAHTLYSEDSPVYVQRQHTTLPASQPGHGTSRLSASSGSGYHKDVPSAGSIYNRDMSNAGPVYNRDALNSGPVRHRDVLNSGPVYSKDVVNSGPVYNRDVLDSGPTYNRDSSTLRSIYGKDTSVAHSTLEYLNQLPDVYHPDGLSYHHMKGRDQDQVVSQQDPQGQRWPGYSTQHVARDVAREHMSRLCRGTTTTTLDLVTLARSTTSALEEFLRPTDSISFPVVHHSAQAPRTHGAQSQKDARGMGAATSRMSRCYSEPLHDDVPCRDQTAKSALPRSDSIPSQDIRPSIPPSSNQSWTIGTAWGAGRAVHESRRPFARHHETTRTLTPLSWLLNDDTRSTSSSSSASSDSESRSSHSASLWLSDCPSMGSDGPPARPHPPSTAAPKVLNGRSTSHTSLSHQTRHLSSSDVDNSYNGMGEGDSSHLQQRCLLRPWLAVSDSQGSKTGRSSLHNAALPSQPVGLTCTQRIMQELMGDDGGCRSGRSSSSSWLSDTKGSLVGASSGDKLVTTSRLCNANEMISPVLARSPSQYQDLSCPLALELANELLACLKLPGNFQYVPVSEDSPLYMLGVVYEFTAFDVALGSTYYQRLRHGFSNSSLLMDRLLGSPQIPGQARLAPVRRYLRQEHLSQLARKQAFLSVLQYVSLLLAAKVLGSRTDLSSETLRMHITRAYQMPVPLERAVEVEVLCLQKLQWRLGPFLEEDQLDWLTSLEWL